MRILVLNHEYPPVGGGGGVFCRDLAEAWAQMGHKVDIVTSRARRLPRRETNAGITVYRVFAGPRSDFHQASLLNQFLFILFGFIQAIRLSRRHSYYFLNTHFALPAGPVGYLAQLFLKIPNILTLHGADIYDPSRSMSGHRFWITRLAVALVVKKANQVIASTPEIKQKAEKYFSIPKNKIKIIPLGFSSRYLLVNQAKKYSSHGPLRLVTVGRLVKRKNLKLMIKAISQIQAGQVQLTIIGDGPLKSQLKSLINEQKLTGQIQLTGRLSEEEKTRQLHRADLFISTAIHEGFGLVFLEAMHAGLPIIAGNQGGQTYFLKEGQNACFFKSGDLADLEQKIDFFLKNRQALAQMGKRNQERVKDFFIEKIAGRYLKLNVD